MLSSGSTRMRIPLSVTAGRKIPLPPLHEQSAICEFIGNTEFEFERLSGEAERAISLLKERRAALISAAVTGQIDVRGAA